MNSTKRIFKQCQIARQEPSEKDESGISSGSEPQKQGESPHVRETVGDENIVETTTENQMESNQTEASNERQSTLHNNKPDNQTRFRNWGQNNRYNQPRHRPGFRNNWNNNPHPQIPFQTARNAAGNKNPRKPKEKRIIKPEEIKEGFQCFKGSSVLNFKGYDM